MPQLLGGMSPARFLRDHWQKKPLLVRGAFSAFKDPISPDELAGLACEDGVESRIVRGAKKRWEVTYGPHPESRFAEMPERNWTLLVQEVNRHVPDAALLLDPFSFVPSVRVDDVMVSFAAPGGSVGPHLDSYDVFLVQGQGMRRWRYGMQPAKDAHFVPGLELRILEKFEPDADEVLEPGDMLYIPPGFAHHGIAVTPCLTYSIGFRAPRAGEMWRSFAETSALSMDADVLLSDPPLVPATNAGAIPPALLTSVRAMVRSMDGSDDAIDRWFAAFATRLKPGHEIEPPKRRPDPAVTIARLKTGASLARTEEGRWAFLPRARGALLLYVGGAEIAVEKGAANLARLLCTKRRFAGEEIAPYLKNAPGRALIVHLFAIGALRFSKARALGAPASRR
jgi:50S ribosomal protein L16 3-hydroxylase